MYIAAIVSTLAAWALGLVLDANIQFGDPQGFLCLRVLLPVLAMGLCLLRAENRRRQVKFPPEEKFQKSREKFLNFSRLFWLLNRCMYGRGKRPPPDPSKIQNSKELFP